MTPRLILTFALPIVVIMIVGIICFSQFQPKEAATAIELKEPNSGSRSAVPIERSVAKTVHAPPMAVSQPVSEPVSVPDVDLNFEIPKDVSKLTGQFWEDHLSKVINNDILTDREVGQRLVTAAANRHAPVEIRARAATEALVFTDDENYAQDIGPLAVRTDLPEEINDAIYADLIIRDRGTVLPVAKEIARLSKHTLAPTLADWILEVSNTAN